MNLDFILIYFAFWWTGPRKKEEYSKMIEKLMGIGCDMDQALVALSSCNWDMNKAIEQIFG